MRCPVLVGRFEALESFGTALTRALSGRGTAIGLVGEPGIGKSRLLGEYGARAKQRDVLFLRGQASAEMSRAPLRPLCEALLVATRDRPRPTSVELQPFLGALGQLLPHWRANGWVGSNESSLVAAEAVLRLFRELAGGGALVIGLEDLHWADDQSLEMLEYLIGHCAEIPVVLCLTVRPEERCGPRVVAMLQRGGAIVHTLPRLSAAEVDSMIWACTGTSPDGHRAVSDAAEGLPLVVEDLLSAGTAVRFGEGVLGRVRRLDAAQLRAVRVAALLGVRPELDVAAQGSGTRGTDWLEAAISLGLLVRSEGRIAFRHAMTRAVILDDIPIDERTRLARAAGDALSRSSIEPLMRSLRSAELLGEGGRASEAVTLLLGTGARCQHEGDLRGARAVLQAAFEQARAERFNSVAAIGRDLVGATLQTGEPAAAIVLAEQLLGLVEGRDRPTETDLRLQLARGEIARGRWSEARGHLGEVATGDRERAVSAEIAILQAECALGEDRPGQRAVVQHLAIRGVALAKAAGDAELEAEALELAGRVARMRDLGAAAASLRSALEVTERHQLSYRRLQILNELGTVEMLRDAHPGRLVRARQEAVRCGASGLAASAGLNLASAYAMTGRVSECLIVAREVAALAERLGQTPLLAGCEFIEGVGHAFLGDQVRAERHLAHAERLAPDDADLRAGTWGIGRGVGALIGEDRPAAQRAFARAESEGPARYARILDAALGPAELLAALAGDASSDHARQLLAAQVQGARWHGLWLGAAISVSLAHEHNGDQAAAELATALEAGDRYPLFAALVRRLVAEAALETRFVDPVPLLRDAERAFDTLRLLRSATAVRGLLRRLGAAAPRRRRGDATVPAQLSRSGVTAREAEVLGLLADRLSNRQIAEELFVSTKTVEKHVASLARKLLARDRLELAEVARSLRR